MIDECAQAVRRADIKRSRTRIASPSKRRGGGKIAASSRFTGCDLRLSLYTGGPLCSSRSALAWALSCLEANGPRSRVRVRETVRAGDAEVRQLF